VCSADPHREKGLHLPASAGCVVALVLCLGTLAVARDDAIPEHRIEQLNRAFLDHLRALDGEYALAVNTIKAGWEQTYRDESPGTFVPDALAVLYPQYRDAMAAFDEHRWADAARLFEPLRTHVDPYLAETAEYYHVRALAALGRYEDAEALLADLDDRLATLAAHTPLAPHLLFVRACCESRNLRFDAAGGTLDALEARFDDAPEMVRIGARQLRLELERREQATLGEVATVMDYVADRLGAADGTERVQERQQQVIAMLDKLIEQHEQEESQSGGKSGKPDGSPQQKQQTPRAARRESDAPEGSGRMGELHGVPQADPGEMWGKMPPAERERVLQSIRERFPSRYRQLVEQYYRTLAEGEQRSRE